MPHRRKGAPGSFGAPFDELLPRLTSERDQPKVEVRRKSGEGSRGRLPDRASCRVFLLNESLYERAKE